jgi:hypothetical protein
VIQRYVYLHASAPTAVTVPRRLVTNSSGWCSPLPNGKRKIAASPPNCCNRSPETCIVENKSATPEFFIQMSLNCSPEFLIQMSLNCLYSVYSNYYIHYWNSSAVSIVIAIDTILLYSNYYTHNSNIVSIVITIDTLGIRLLCP